MGFIHFLWWHQYNSRGYSDWYRNKAIFWKTSCSWLYCELVLLLRDRLIFFFFFFCEMSLVIFVNIYIYYVFLHIFSPQMFTNRHKPYHTLHIDNLYVLFFTRPRFSWWAAFLQASIRISNHIDRCSGRNNSVN